MRREQAQVYLFMAKAGQDRPSRPTIPPFKVCWLRLKLIGEELFELAAAFFRRDIVGVADAVTDLLVVVLGTAVACGIEIAPCWEEVYRSNMSKFIDGHQRADGKWIKGPSWSPPDLGEIIERQKQSRRSI